MYIIIYMKKVFLFLILTLLLTSCTNNSSTSINSIEDLYGKKCGVITGSFHDSFMEQNYSDKNIQIVYQDSVSELLVSLKTNKIDCFLTDTPTAILLSKENLETKTFEIKNSSIDSGFIFSKKSSDVLSDFNIFLKTNKESGYLAMLADKWINDPDINTYIEKKEYTPTKRTINVVLSTDSPPYNYLANNEYQGYCVEVLYEFAYQSGYGLNIDSSSFSGMLSGISSDKYDIGVNEINITEERKKSIIFSDPIHSCTISAVVLKSNDEGEIIENIEDLQGKTMGCMSGSIYDLTIKKNIKDSNIVYFNSRSELIMGLQSNKISGYLADKPVAMVNCFENERIRYIDEPLEEVEYGFCFSDNASNIKKQFNEYLNKVNKDGTLKQLQEKWINEEGINKTIDDMNLTGENGTIKACTTPDAAPFSFYRNNKYEGYETELIKKFAYEYGYNIEIDTVSFDAIISAISSNKYDVAFNGIYITEERKQSVDFSDPVYNSIVVAVVKNDNIKEANIFEIIKEKFYKTFVEEERYKIILGGIKTTLIITAASLFFGTVCGFAIFLLSRKLGKWFIYISDAMAYLISGMPVVVLLMVLFYIIFAQSSFSGTIISIVGFSLIVCYSFYGMLKTGVGAIDKGQFEAAMALGYTDNQTLFKFILPQAFRIIMPSYRNEIISLIKSSSVVGYVTVEDLTRASDLIRSRTYDAFFPLIVTAIIYFIMAWLLTKLANSIQNKFLPNEKSKNEILKNVKQ